MKTKSFLTALAVINLLIPGAIAQVTVTTVATNGLSEPYNVTVDADDNVYVSDSASGSNALFRYPIGLDQDTNGNVYIADFGNNAVRVMNLNDPAFGVATLALSGTTLNRPTAVAVAGTNQLWVADTGNQLIKLI